MRLSSPEDASRGDLTYMEDDRSQNQGDTQYTRVPHPSSFSSVRDSKQDAGRILTPSLANKVPLLGPVLGQ